MNELEIIGEIGGKGKPCEKFLCQQRETVLSEFDEHFSDMGQQIDELETANAELKAEVERLRELPNELVDWLKSARHKDARGHYVNWVDVLRGLAAIKYGIVLGVKND